MTHALEPICHVLLTVDGDTEEVVDVLEIPGFDLNSFAKQFDVPVETDPDMLDRYAVGPPDVDFLHRTVSPSLVFDFTNMAYFIEAVQNDT